MNEGCKIDANAHMCHFVVIELELGDEWRGTILQSTLVFAGFDAVLNGYNTSALFDPTKRGSRWSASVTVRMTFMKRNNLPRIEDAVDGFDPLDQPRHGSEGSTLVNVLDFLPSFTRPLNTRL